MAFATTTSRSLLTLHNSVTPHSLFPPKPSFTLFAFPNLPLKTPRNPLPGLSCTAKPLPYHNENGLARLSLGLEEEEEEEAAAATEDFFDADYEEEEIEHGGICAVPKKRRSRSKTRIRKNIWKRKARVAALKAYSLAKSIATGNSRSFLVINKSSSSSTSTTSS